MQQTQPQINVDNNANPLGTSVMAEVNQSGIGYSVQSANPPQPSQQLAENPYLANQMSSMSLSSSSSSKNRAKRVYQSATNSIAPPALGAPILSPPGDNNIQSQQPNQNQIQSPPNQFQQPGPQGPGFTSHNQFRPQADGAGFAASEMNGHPQFQPGMPQSGMHPQPGMQPQPGMHSQQPRQIGMQQPVMNGQPASQQSMAVPNQYQPLQHNLNQYPGQPNQYQRTAAPQQPGFPKTQPPAQKIDPDQIPSAVAVRAEDQAKYGNTVFSTSSRGVPPIATTQFKCADEGTSIFNSRQLESKVHSVYFIQPAYY
jgi:protein transport protein SEC24